MEQITKQIEKMLRQEIGNIVCEQMIMELKQRLNERAFRHKVEKTS